MRSHNPSLVLCAWCGRHLRYGQRCPCVGAEPRHALLGLLLIAVALVGLGLLGTAGCGHTAQIKTLTVISRTVDAVPSAMKLACDGTVIACAAQKLNPCKLLADCQTAERQVRLTVISVKQLILDALNAYDLGNKGASAKLSLVMTALAHLNGLLQTWGVDVVGRLLPLLLGGGA
jgi:hypothetical protein